MAQNRIDKTKLDEKNVALLEFVEVLTKEPSQVRDGHVQKMRRTGWTDEEIFEAAFDTALFAFYNRMADAYGLDYPEHGWLPPKADGSSRAASTESASAVRPAER